MILFKELFKMLRLKDMYLLFLVEEDTFRHYDQPTQKKKQEPKDKPSILFVKDQRLIL